MTKTLQIDIWSDVMCPWCAIGFAQLKKGLDLISDEVTAEIRWHPFELDPEMVPEGKSQDSYLAEKYGRSPAEMVAARLKLHEVGERAGFSFAYAGRGSPPEAMTWNTLLAHKLLLWTLGTAGPAAQTQLKEALFEAHFRYRRNMADLDVLLDIAEAQGLDRAAAEDALVDPDLTLAVHEEEYHAQTMQITGVPAMVVEGKYLISGAHEPQVYADALRRVAAQAG